MSKPPEDEQARFETLLSHALGDDDKALAHRAAKTLRGTARHQAVGRRQASSATVSGP